MPGCISSALQEYHTISIELMVRANTALGDEIYVVGEVCCALCACWTRSNCSHHMRSCSRRNSVCGTRSARSNCPPTRKYFRSGRRRCCLAMAQTACDARGRRCQWLLHRWAPHPVTSMRCTSTRVGPRVDRCIPRFLAPIRWASHPAQSCRQGRRTLAM